MSIDQYGVQPMSRAITTVGGIPYTYSSMIYSTIQFPRCSNFLMLYEELYLCKDILHITPGRVCVLICKEERNHCKELSASILIDLQGGFPFLVDD